MVRFPCLVFGSLKRSWPLVCSKARSMWMVPFSGLKSLMRSANSSSCARSQPECEDRVEGSSLDTREQLGNLFFGEDYDLRVVRLRRAHESSNISLHYAHGTGMAERLMQQAVNVTDRARRQPGFQQLGVQSLKVRGLKFLKLYLSNIWSDLILD